MAVHLDWNRSTGEFQRGMAPWILVRKAGRLPMGTKKVKDDREGSKQAGFTFSNAADRRRGRDGSLGSPLEVAGGATHFRSGSWHWHLHWLLVQTSFSHWHW